MTAQAVIYKGLQGLPQVLMGSVASGWAKCFMGCCRVVQDWCIYYRKTGDDSRKYKV
tara:strand:+ start:68 stop:238 length:171 start_codon:yes stop_codon:yes gene_type:complete